MPAPGVVTRDPKSELSVWAALTVVPVASTALRWVVSGEPTGVAPAPFDPARSPLPAISMRRSAASTALPPIARISSAAALASGWFVVTTAREATTGCLKVFRLIWQ